MTPAAQAGGRLLNRATKCQLSSLHYERPAGRFPGHDLGDRNKQLRASPGIEPWTSRTRSGGSGTKLQRRAGRVESGTLGRASCSHVEALRS